MVKDQCQSVQQSCLYRGTVHHARHLPHEHRFMYRLFMVYLDLDELDRVFKRRWLWSTRFPTVAWFRRRDHLGDPKQPLAESVRELVHQQTGKTIQGPIRLLTHLRYFGFMMNPVSYFYCFDAEDKKLEAVVAEINNTPWGERHCYVVTPETADSEELLSGHKKDFHVSPFMPMDMLYAWRFSKTDASVTVDIRLEKEGHHYFDAHLKMHQLPMTSWNLTKTLFRFPCMTATVILAIYWQAFRLWLKKTPYYPHPNKNPRTNTLRQNNRSLVHSDMPHESE